MTQHRFHVFETAHGFCGIAWGPTGIVRFQLPTQDATSTERHVLRRVPAAIPGNPPSPVAETIAAAIRYFAGEHMDFSAVQLDIGDQSPFFTAIYDALRRVGYGQTTTYGTLATQLGAGPQASRDVGQAMANNPVPLIIPCHRVLAANGKLGGFSAPGGANAKLRMLALEGVQLGPPPSAQASLLL